MIKKKKGNVCINYKTEDFVAWVEETGGKGVDVILDNIGRAYFEGDIDSLNVDGTLFIIGFQGGTVAEVNLSGLLARCLTAYKYFPLTEAAEAHQLMESSKHVGKIPCIQLCYGYE
uniref:Alcohol dehydrogenase-like C-terminal domain-containing protein n=1 Tax=Vitis vinifera TaxID=29760 RepID=F6HXI6_VITVI